MGVYGTHRQVKCLFKALIFGACQKHILIYSQMRFQLYQSHSLTVTGLKSGKKSINWVFVGDFETLRWPYKLQASSFSQKNITHISCV